jgi:hypothetical protein
VSQCLVFQSWIGEPLYLIRLLSPRDIPVEPDPKQFRDLYFQLRLSIEAGLGFYSAENWVRLSVLQLIFEGAGVSGFGRKEVFDRIPGGSCPQKRLRV